MLRITKINIYIQQHGQDVIEFCTEIPEPLLTAEPGQMLSLIGRATRMRGEQWARATFPDIEVEVFNYFSGRLKSGS